MFKNMWSKFAAKIVQPDPKPEPSILDILDSRGTVPLDDDGPALIHGAHVQDPDAVAAYYARVTEVQKRSAWS